jgi:hypothetical protein
MTYRFVLFNILTNWLFTVQSSTYKFNRYIQSRFIDDDNDPDKIENGYTFYNKEVIVRLESIKETTKEKFKEFLLKVHTINIT